MINLKRYGALLLLVAAPLSPSYAASTPFEIDVKELERPKKPAPPPAEKKAKQGKKRPPPEAASHPAPGAKKVPEGYLRYTVKPGDHIFKILMGPFGMSNEEAERLIPEIVRINGISDIRSLDPGQALLIPGKKRREQAARAEKREKERFTGGKTVPPPQAAAAPEPKRRERPPHAESAPPAPPRRRTAEPPAPAPAPRGAPGTVSVPEPVVPAIAPKPAPAAAYPSSGAAAPGSPQDAPETPPVVTWICPVTTQEPAAMVDSILNALSTSWSKKKILESGKEAPLAYSILVDRYFEYKGGRYVVSIGETDAYSYTLFRLLETEGYRVLILTGREDFHAVSEKLLKLVGVRPDFGRHMVQEGKGVTGFLVPEEAAGGKRVVVTRDRVDQRGAWVLAPGCGAR